MRRVIVFDLDDTISFCHDRDWPNAKPNIELIRKINKLYNEGWYIHIYSARGTISGTDYYSQVSRWLHEHGVLFHRLQFGKPLAALYVDDKCVTAADFVDLDIREIPGGWSGQKVVKIGGKIFKTDLHIHDTVRWYQFAKEFYYVPEVLSVVGTDLVLKYIEPKGSISYQACKYIVESFQALPPITKHTWKDYVDRIKGHTDWLKEHKQLDLSKILYRLTDMIPPEHTFSHGDFTPDNIVVGKRDRPHLIDPLLVTYSSWELDMAKLNSWALRHNMEIEVPVNALIIAETIRTLKYAPEEMYTKLSTICLNYLNL
jgi:hypothetical protein